MEQHVRRWPFCGNGGLAWRPGLEHERKMLMRGDVARVQGPVAHKIRDCPRKRAPRLLRQFLNFLCERGCTGPSPRVLFSLYCSHEGEISLFFSGSLGQQSVRLLGWYARVVFCIFGEVVSQEFRGHAFPTALGILHYQGNAIIGFLKVVISV